MDAFLNATYDICFKLLPFLGCLCLIFLMFFLRKCIVFLTTLSKTMNKVDQTIDTAEKRLAQLEAPLTSLSDTVVKVNHTIDIVDKRLDQLEDPLTAAANVAKTVDAVNAYGNKIVKDAFLYLSENIGIFRDWILNTFHKKPTSSMVKEEKETENESEQ